MTFAKFVEMSYKPIFATSNFERNITFSDPSDASFTLSIDVKQANNSLSKIHREGNKVVEVLIFIVGEGANKKIHTLEREYKLGSDKPKYDVNIDEYAEDEIGWYFETMEEVFGAFIISLNESSFDKKTTVYEATKAYLLELSSKEEMTFTRVFVGDKSFGATVTDKLSTFDFSQSEDEAVLNKTVNMSATVKSFGTVQEIPYPNESEINPAQ